MPRSRSRVARTTNASIEDATPARDVVRLPLDVRRAIIAHARRERPRECCGLLVGRGRRVSFAVAATNVEASETRFRLDDREHLTLRRVLRAFQPPLAIIGVYHSHPNGDAWPSETDVAEAAYPAWLYVIVGLKTTRAAVGAFRLRNGRILRVTLRAKERDGLRTVGRRKA
jgi:proteasome lid subunit RPN8/RPN11